MHPAGLELRKSGAIVIFIVVLIAYTIQTELAQHVQNDLGFRKPYLLLYITHTGYSLILPLHLLVFKLMGISIPNSLSILRGVLRLQFSSPAVATRSAVRSPSISSPSTSGRDQQQQYFPNGISSLRLVSPGGSRISRRPSTKSLLPGGERGRGKGAWKWNLGSTVICLTFLIAAPALTWYAAVPLTSMTDITAIYNTFAFFVYLLAIKFLHEKPTNWKLSSVLVAITGVFTIAYGDSFISSHIVEKDAAGEEAKSRLLGNLLALGGSISYAWYEVWYKIHVALPDSEASEASAARINEEEEAEGLLEPSDEESADSDVPPKPSSPTSPTPKISPSLLSISSPSLSDEFVTHPSSQTFLLYSNLITSLIGLTTFLVLWIPIPLLHLVGWEIFEAPPREAWLPIACIVMSGVTFNAGFMVLLSLWGPVIASVGNLCTLLLVGIADTVLTHNPLSKWTLLGGGMVVLAFGMLVWGARLEENEER